MVAKYIQIKKEIKSWILEGKIAPKEKIASETELTQRFGVSRHTIRQAVGDLVHEGWLYRVQGGGTYCTDRLGKSNVSSGKTIGVITTYISDYIFPSIIRGIESYVSEKGYSLLIASTNNNIELEKRSLQNILNQNIDGLIVEPTKSAFHSPNINYYLNLERNHIPYITINASYTELGAPSITLDDEKGGFIATEHLIKLGHQRILGVFKTDDLQGIARMKGYMRAHRENQIIPYPDMIINFSTEEPEEVLQAKIKKLLLKDKTVRPEAIVCYNDAIALSILHVIRDIGLSVPTDISIVGYDDSQLAKATEVKLTSIKHPKTELGNTAAQTIIKLIESSNPLGDKASKVYEPELVIRTSTTEKIRDKV